MSLNADDFSTQARAKINLFLDILERRDDGYHAIQSVMQTVELADTVRIVPRANDQILLSCSDPSLPAGSENLAVRAALAMRGAFPGLVGGFDIFLDKRIPVGAGLGGGSADAAAVLQLIRKAARLDASDVELIRVAAQVGSDTPFFVSGGAALACGRGEVLTPIENNCVHGGIVVVCPNACVSTPQAYRWWDESGMPRTRARAESLINALRAGDWKAAARHCENAFQQIVEERVPAITAARRDLMNSGCLTSVMSGSGAAVFGLTETEQAARMIAERLKDRYPLVSASSSSPVPGSAGVLARKRESASMPDSAAQGKA